MLLAQSKNVVIFLLVNILFYVLWFIFVYFRYCAGDFTAKVTIDDIDEFEKTQNITILKINKTDGKYDSNETEITAYTLNVICEQLWIRDQNYILNQEMESSQIV